jgi:hypothetical protein
MAKFNIPAQQFLLARGNWYGAREVEHYVNLSQNEVAMMHAENDRVRARLAQQESQRQGLMAMIQQVQTAVADLRRNAEVEASEILRKGREAARQRGGAINGQVAELMAEKQQLSTDVKDLRVEVLEILEAELARMQHGPVTQWLNQVTGRPVESEYTYEAEQAARYLAKNGPQVQPAPEEVATQSVVPNVSAAEPVATPDPVMSETPVVVEPSDPAVEQHEQVDTPQPVVPAEVAKSQAPQPDTPNLVAQLAAMTAQVQAEQDEKRRSAEAAQAQARAERARHMQLVQEQERAERERQTRNAQVYVQPEPVQQLHEPVFEPKPEPIQTISAESVMAQSAQNQNSFNPDLEPMFSTTVEPRATTIPPAEPNPDLEDTSTQDLLADLQASLDKLQLI